MNTNLPPHIIRNLDDLNRVARNHPALFLHASSAVFSMDGLAIYWWKRDATQNDMLALVHQYPNAGWKRRPSSEKGDFDFVATIDGVRVDLQGAESIGFLYESSTVDVSKLPKPNAERSNPATL